MLYLQRFRVRWLLRKWL